MKSDKYSAFPYQSRKGLQAQVLLSVGMVMGLVVVIYYMMNMGLKSDVEELPRWYSSLMETSVQTSDMVAECKSKYESDMAISRLQPDSQIPEYVTKSIQSCKDLDAALAVQKSSIQNFYDSDFYTKLTSKSDLSRQEMIFQRDSFSETAKQMQNALNKYRRADYIYRHDKQVQQYQSIKKSMSAAPEDSQLTARFDIMDRAIAEGNQERFMLSYLEFNSFLKKRAIGSIDRAIMERNAVIKTIQQEKIKQASDDTPSKIDHKVD